MITATCQGSGTCDLTKPTLTLNASGKTYDGSVVTASLTKSSTWSSQGLPTPTITYSPANSKNVGTYTASATVGNATATQQFTISPKEVGLTWGANTFTYDGRSHAPTATATKLVSGDSCTVAVGGAQTAAGSYTATATGLSNSNYALPSAKTKIFTINPKSIDVTGVKAKDKDYDGNATASFDLMSVGLNGVVEGDDVSVGGVTGSFADKGAGPGKSVTATATLAGTAAGNYTVNPVTGLSATIHRLTTKVSGIEAKEKVYDGSTTATVDTSNATFANMVAGDDLSISATGEFVDANVGEGKTVNLTLGALSGADAGNYLFDENDSQKTATASITAKDMTVGATGYEEKYDGNAHSIAVAVTDPAEGYTITYKGPKDADYSATNPEFTDPGTYEVSYKVVADNYAEFTGAATVKIIGKDFEGIAATSVDTTYDGTLHAISVNVPGTYEPYTITYSETVDGEYATAPITYRDFTDGAKTVYYRVSKTGYNDYKGSATVTIAQKEVGLVWGEAAFTYDGTAKLPSLALTGVESGDSCEAMVDGAQADANAKSGTDKYTATATALSNNNYKLPENATKDFTIAQKEVGLEWGEAAFVYDGTPHAPEATATGVEEGDECKVAVDGAKTDSNTKAGTEKYTATAAGLSDTNYRLPANTTKDFTIAQQEIVVNGITSLGKVYDGTTDATGTLYYEDALLAGKVDGDDLGVKATGVFANKSAGKGKVITLTSLELTGGAAGNYVLAQTGQQKTTTGNITERLVKVTADNKTKVYGEADPPFTYTSDPAKLFGDDVLEGALSRQEGEDVGEHTITLGTLHDHDKNYAIEYTHGILTITKAMTNNVTAAITGWTYGDAANAPSATGTFGADTATFAYSDAADGEYTETVPTDAGTYYVKATVAETGNYVGAVSEPVQFRIAKKVADLQWADAAFAYDGQPHAPTATVANLVGGDTCTVTVAGAQTDSNAKSGETSYTAEATALSNPNYTLPENKATAFTIAQAEITVSGVKANGKTYDGNTDAELSFDGAVLAGKVGDEDVSATATGTFADKNAGEDKKVAISGLALEGGDAGNYVLAADGQQAEATATIDRRPIEVKAEEQTKYFGQADPELAYTVEPKLVEGDEFTGALARTEGEDAGDYGIGLGTLSAGPNYEIGYTPATFEILQAGNSVTAAIEGWTYGDDPNAPSATAGFGADTATFAYSDAAGGDYTDAVPVNAGTYYVKASIAATGNYKGAESEPVAFEVAPKAVGLEWSGTELTYNGQPQGPAATATGLVAGDACDVTVEGVQTDSNAKTGTRAYSAAAVRLSNPNYALPVNPSTVFTIGQQPVTVSGIKANDKAYDGRTDAELDFGEAVLEGRVGEEDVSVTATGAFADANAGEGKAVAITGLALAGEDAANYVLAATGQQDAATATIGKLALAVAAKPAEKAFGQSDPELAYTHDPELVEGDAFEGALERAEGEDAGAYEIGLGSLSAGPNYEISYTPAEFAITQAGNKVEASILGWTYGKEPNAPAARADFGADTATFSYSDSADGDYTDAVPVNAGTYYVKATVPETGNYAGAESEPAAFEIAPKAVGLEWGNTAFTYNGQPQKPTATATGLVDGDACEVTVEGEQVDANAKTGTKVYSAQATGLSNPNYRLPAIAATLFTIDPKPLEQSMLSVAGDAIKADGTKQGPAVAVADGDVALAEGEDYAVTGEASSDKVGTHFFGVEGRGNYTGTLGSSWVMYNEKGSSQTEEGADGAGSVEVFVDIVGNTESVSVDNLTMDFAKALLGEDDLARRDGGEDILLYVELVEQPSADAADADRALLKELFAGQSATDVRWFDIKVWKKVGSDAAVQLHELASDLQMSIAVPDELKGAPEGSTRTFYFGTAHDGKARMVAVTQGEVVAFASREFSTFALAYKDEKAVDPGEGGESGKGGDPSKGGSADQGSAGKAPASKATGKKVVAPKASTVKSKTATAKTGDDVSTLVLTSIVSIAALLFAAAARRKTQGNRG